MLVIFTEYENLKQGSTLATESERILKDKPQWKEISDAKLLTKDQIGIIIYFETHSKEDKSNFLIEV